MKTIIYKIKNTTVKILGTALILGSIVSCNSKMDEPVYDFWGEDFFSSTSRLNMGARGVAEIFSSQDTYGQAWMVFDGDSDISHVQGNSTGHVARDLGHYNIYSSHAWLEAAWGKYYQGIDRANFILAKQDEVVVLDNDKDRKYYNNLIGEVKALRALAYFDLVRLFGDVPYKTQFTILASDKLDYKRDNVENIYEHICKELEAAVELLPWHDETTTGYRGRFSKGAGHALLARVYLFRAGWSLRLSGQMERPAEYMDYYAKAVEHANIVINSGKHALNTSYANVFKNMCDLILEPKENIYEFQFFSVAAQKGSSSVMGTYNGPPIAEGSSFGRANSFIKTHNFFYQTFDDADVRKNVAVATWRIQVVDGQNKYNEVNPKQSYNWSPAKWRRDWHKDTPQDPNNTNVNWVFLRYADVLLMKAEAINEINNGPNADAIEAINQVKRRAYGFNPLVPEVSIDHSAADFDYQTFFEEIMAERARELCFEGHRKLDLIRWDKLGDALLKTKTQFDDAFASNQQNKYEYLGASLFTKNKHELYPIPSREILETGNVWKQNPGYTK